VHDFGLPEAGFAAPTIEIGAREIERLAELDEHVQRHHETKGVLAARIVDDVLNGNECAARGERAVGRLHQVHLLLEVPVVKDHPHRDDVRARQRIIEEIQRLGRDAVGETRGLDIARGDVRDGRQVRGDATHVRMRLCHRYGQQAIGAADVAQRLVTREIELLREGQEIAGGDPRHRLHELLEPLRLAVQDFEHAGAAVLGFVLWFAGAQRVRQVAPERVKASVGHLEESTHVLWTAPIEELQRLDGIAITRAGAFAITLQESECDQRVEEVRIRTVVKVERVFELGAGHSLVAQGGEQFELHRRQQRLGGPERHSDFQDAIGGQCFGHDLFLHEDV
jgi:hypothetical protein